RLADLLRVAERIDPLVGRHQVVVDLQRPGEGGVAGPAQRQHVADGQVEHVAEVALEVQQRVDAVLVVEQHPPRLAEGPGAGPPLAEQGQGLVGVALPEAVGLVVQARQAQALASLPPDLLLVLPEPVAVTHGPRSPSSEPVTRAKAATTSVALIIRPANSRATWWSRSRAQARARGSSPGSARRRSRALLALR